MCIRVPNWILWRQYLEESFFEKNNRNSEFIEKSIFSSYVPNQIIESKNEIFTISFKTVGITTNSYKL